MGDLKKSVLHPPVQRVGFSRAKTFGGGAVVVVVVVVVAATPNYLRQASQNLGKYIWLVISHDNLCRSCGKKETLYRPRTTGSIASICQA